MIKKKRVRIKKQDLTKMREGYARHLEEAPRLANGRIVPGYRYKNLLEAHKEMGNTPRKVDAGVGTPLFLKRPTIEKVLIRGIRKGLPYTTVCRRVGISRDTFLRWLELGRDGNPIYKNFYKKICRAEAKAEEGILDKLRSHADIDWRVSAWQLERRWPESWSKRDGFKAELKVNGNLSVTHKEELGKQVISDEDARDLARKLIDGSEYGFSRVADDAQVVDEGD